MINIKVSIHLLGSLQNVGVPHPPFSPALLTNSNLLESWTVFMIEQLTLWKIYKKNSGMFRLGVNCVSGLFTQSFCFPKTVSR